MQDLIRQIEEINKDYRNENSKLITLLGQVMNCSIEILPHTNPNGRITGLDHNIQQSDQLSHHKHSRKSQQLSQPSRESSKHSRRSKHMSNHSKNSKEQKRVSKGSARHSYCLSCNPVDASRNSASPLRKSQSKLIKHQSNIMRLSKLTRKIIPRVSKTWLFAKKSAISRIEL